MADRARPTLLFVSPRFLFPADSGGKIRTGDVLRGMHGGRFEVVLASPAPADTAPFEAQLARVCDRFVSWPEVRRGKAFPILRLRHLLSRLPIPVATDRSAAGRRVVVETLRQHPAVVVIDFPHTAVLAPDTLDCPSVLFTHNVEAQIFDRHVEVARNPVMRAVWRNQAAKMARFERETLRRFDRVVAVSERDQAYFEREYGLANVSAIPTGVDLEFFRYRPADPARNGDTLVFTGAMDWLANIDAVQLLMDGIWPLIAAARPDARLVVIGKNPPAALVDEAKRRGLAWRFTGFVDDVREHVQAGDVSVIPLRVGSGTRIKAFEAMALGRPVVSTSIGVDGLQIEPGEHYLRADTPAEFAAECLRLLGDAELRLALAERAHRHVAAHFSAGKVAEAFERICCWVGGLD